MKTVAAAAAACGDRGTIKKKDIVKNPQSLAPPKVCLSCVQSSHDVDRDTDPAAQIYVIWSKALLDKKTGARAPSGDECYRCFDTRRRHFGLGFKEMLENRKQSKTLDEKFLELRRARACGDKYKHKSEEDVVDVERFISKDKPQYDDRYESGTFYELWSFAKLRRLPFKAFFLRPNPGVGFSRKPKEHRPGNFQPDCLQPRLPGPDRHIILHERITPADHV